MRCTITIRICCIRLVSHIRTLWSQLFCWCLFGYLLCTTYMWWQWNLGAFFRRMGDGPLYLLTRLLYRERFLLENSIGLLLIILYTCLYRFGNQFLWGILSLITLQSFQLSLLLPTCPCWPCIRPTTKPAQRSKSNRWSYSLIAKAGLFIW